MARSGRPARDSWRDRGGVRPGDAEAEFAQRLRELNVDRSSGERKPHKPLLLLYAIARLLAHGERALAYPQVEQALAPLLRAFAPPIAGRVRPENPYWHLCNDGVWEIDEVAALERTAAGFPRAESLRKSHGHLPARFLAVLEASPPLAARVIQQLLDDHFAPSLHADVLAAVGLVGADAAAAAAAADESLAQTLCDSTTLMQRETLQRWRRPDGFARAVMAAYDYRCAVTGFRAELVGVPFALDAAHLHWHCKGGPATLANGVALHPTLHRLLDYGAWTLSDDRRVIVSKRYVESTESLAVLAPLHGKRLRDPALPATVIAIEHIRWHREPRQGGVFRG